MTLGDLLDRACILCRASTWPIVVLHPEKGQFNITYQLTPPGFATRIEFIAKSKVYDPFYTVPIRGEPREIRGSGICMDDPVDGWYLASGSIACIEAGIKMLTDVLSQIKREGLYER